MDSKGIKRTRRPTPPGMILREMYLKPRDISVSGLAKAIGCSRKHLSDIVNGKARIDAGMAARLARALETTTELWLNLQRAVDLFDAEQDLADWQPATIFRAVQPQPGQER